MKAVSAHVRNGQIMLDEPIELHEGVAVAVLVPDQAEMSSEDLAELEAALAEGTEQFERGEFEDARAFAVRLAARP